jgi:hypothetical protein
MADNVANDSGDMIVTTGASIVDTDPIDAAYPHGRPRRLSSWRGGCTRNR